MICHSASWPAKSRAEGLIEAEAAGDCRGDLGGMAVGEVGDVAFHKIASCCASSCTAARAGGA
jgi:hypothetical protein